MNINIGGRAEWRGEEDKREVALVTEEYTELLSRGGRAGRWEGVELQEITPWEVRSNYILVFNEGGNIQREMLIVFCGL